MGSGVKFDVIEFLKLAPKYFLPLLLFSAMIIFIPGNWLEYLHLDSIVAEYRWIPSILFIFSLSMFIGGILLKVYDEMNKKIRNKRLNKNIKNKLKNLSNTQRNILLRFVEEDVNSVPLPVSNGEVADLENNLIVYRATRISNDIGEDGYYFDYCLQPLAEKIIKNNIRLIKSGRQMAEKKQSIYK
ncbi:super-infection exclusion protein B [Paucisalibacillus globulus]|uniref:super-infection exclusion protein B n=1 Tax=Paucisalibacillus globulus TaxID=351095 RepID=UPI000BB81535|nr:super-infection exclusion protein B [Paucisalibacillus globulus]